MTISRGLAEHLIRSGLKMDEEYYAAGQDVAAPVYSSPPPFGPPPAYGHPTVFGPPPAYGRPTTFSPPRAFDAPTEYRQPAQYSPLPTFGASDYGLPTTYSPPSIHGTPMTYGPPPVAKSNNRRSFLIVGALLGVIGIAGGVAALNVHQPTTSTSSAGYNNPRRLENAITAAVNQRLSDPTGPYYSKGVSVEDVICVSKTAHTFTCNIEASDGGSESVDAVVTADGQRFVTK